MKALFALWFVGLSLFAFGQDKSLVKITPSGQQKVCGSEYILRDEADTKAPVIFQQEGDEKPIRVRVTQVEVREGGASEWKVRITIRMSPSKDGKQPEIDPDSLRVVFTLPESEIPRVYECLSKK